MKSIQKSIRMTDEVFEAIDSFDGQGFNDKLERLVLAYLKDRARIQRELILLQTEIDSKRQDLRYIRAQVSAARDVRVSFDALVHAVTAFLDV